jgi:hypothetical protein
MPWLDVPHLQQTEPGWCLPAHIAGDQAHLFDPAVENAPATVSVGDLLLAWSHFDYTYAVLYV